MGATEEQSAGGPEALAARVQELTASLETIEDPFAQAIAEDLVGALIDLYGEGLERIVGTLAAAGEPGANVTAALEADGVVASLLLMHGLYSVPLADRVQEGLEAVRPYMETHGGNVELVGVEDGVARLRLEGSCHGCSASQATLEHAIEEALEATAPDLIGLDVEGVVAPEDGTPPPVTTTGPELPMCPAPAPAATPKITVEQSAPAAREGGCELCPSGLADNHRHLLHLGERRIVCVCETCWSLRSGEAEYVPTGNRTMWLEDLRLDDDIWASFDIPIGLAFFLRSGESGGIVALYPSPVGATESEIDDAAWIRLVAVNPELVDLQPDAEALIVNRMSDPHRFAIAPIDRCYELVGLVKSSWEGISGGGGLEPAIAGFFDELHANAGITA